jgi:hypothetical protein
MADIEALLGLRGDDLPALARELRGQVRGGDVLGLSTIPQVAAMGQAQRKRAAAGATRGGALARAREAEAARQAAREEAQAWRESRAEATDEYRDAQLGLSRAWLAQSNKDDSKKWFAARPVKARGVNLLMQSSPSGEVRYTLAGGQEFTQEEFDALAEEEIETLRQQELAKARGKSIVEDEADLREKTSGLVSLARDYETGMAAIDEGALSGTLQSPMPTLRASSAKLDNARQSAGLNTLASTDVVLTPLSDPDREWMINVAIPQSMDEDDLYFWLKKRREGIQRTVEAYRAQQTYMAENGRRMPREEIDAMLYEDGFAFADPPKVKDAAMARQLDLDTQDLADWNAMSKDERRLVYQTEMRSR